MPDTPQEPSQLPAELKGQMQPFQLPVEILGSELEAGVLSPSTVSDGDTKTALRTR